MKTHLPKGLRAALMAALASVSLTSYATAAVQVPDKSIDWDNVGISGKVSIYDSKSSIVATTDKSKKRYDPLLTTGSIHVVASNSVNATDYYVDFFNPKSVSINGAASVTKASSNIYYRKVGGNETVNADSLSAASAVLNATVNNTYVELHDLNATYTGANHGGYAVFAGDHASTIKGTSTFVIRSGIFNGNVCAGFRDDGTTGGIIEKDAYLQVTGGTFNKRVVAGSFGKGAAINGSSHLYITGGTYNDEVVGGNNGINGGATISGSAETIITSGTFKNFVYGGSIHVNDSIGKGIDMTVAGGTYTAGKGIYAAGWSGNVSDHINLTIDGDVKFADSFTITAGTREYPGKTNPTYGSGLTSTVTLRNLTSSSGLATNSTIKVSGVENPAVDTALVIDKVNTAIQAQLSNFTSMQVTNGSELTLNSATNANLGGVSSVVVDDNSTLNLDSGTGQAWTDYTGSIEVKSGSKLHLSGATAAKSLIVGNGSTLSVKEGDLFTGDADAGSSISVTDATLAANEGNWDLNRTATVGSDGGTVTITGEHYVTFGSVDEGATVTMAGTLDATNGHLVLENTAVAESATLKGKVTFEGTVQNSGTLSIADGAVIGITDKTIADCLSDGDHFSDGYNGFLLDDTVTLVSGGTISYSGTHTLMLNGTEDTKLNLHLSAADGVNKLVMDLGGELGETYFVNQGTVDYATIAAHAGDKKLDEYEIALDGGHMTLNSVLGDKVTLVSYSDHAEVQLGADGVLAASKTNIGGEANEVHVTGEGTVLLDDASKISQLAGDATMKLSGESTTISGESKMTGKLEVEGGKTLTVEGEGSVASFSAVKLDSGSKLTSENSDTIKSLSGSGTLEKTGTGKLAISGDSGEFTGSVNIGAGTLEVQNNMNAASLSGSGKLAKTGTGDMTVKNASEFTGNIEVSGGTLQLEQVDLTGTKAPQKVSVSGGAAVNLVGMGEGVDGVTIELKIDGGTFGVYSGTDAAESNVTGLTLAAGGKIVIGESTDKNVNVLEANLATLSDSILDFSSGGQLTMGCTLDVGKGTIIVLSEDNYALASEGVAVTLFNDVDNTEMQDYVRVTLKSTSGQQMLGEVSFQNESGDIKLTVKGIPEPTTGTLSLLALAGLCARRRRKH